MNLVIVRKTDHTTDWYFGAIARVLRGTLVVNHPAKMVKYLGRQWASFEIRKIVPDAWTDEDDCALLVEAWVYHERKLHAASKYGRGTGPRQDLIRSTEVSPHLGQVSAWYTFITNYLSRAGVHGVDRPEGAQAAAKLVTTTTHHLETVQLVHATLPAPGDTTDGCQPWSAPAKLEQARRQAGVNV